MEPVSKYCYNDLSKLVLGKSVHFISDCELFPNFDVTAKVISIMLFGGEILFKVAINSKRSITIGSNMKNLQFEVLS